MSNNMKLPEERIRIEKSKTVQFILVKIYPLNQMYEMNSRKSSRIFVKVGHETTHIYIVNDLKNLIFKDFFVS